MYKLDSLRCFKWSFENMLGPPIVLKSNYMKIIYFPSFFYLVFFKIFDIYRERKREISLLFYYIIYIKLMYSL